jgi:filamentous hemagglutinin
MEFDGVDCRVEFVTTSPGTDTDVRQARVFLKHPKTGRVVREKFSTLFPDAWSAAEIQRAIQEAYRDADRRGRVEDNGRWSGQTARGVRIDGYLTRDGRRIATAFPVYSPPRQNRSRR